MRESILTPQVKIAAGFNPLMPTFQGLLSEESVMALIEYVKTLKAPAGSVSAGRAAGEQVRPWQPKLLRSSLLRRSRI